MTKTITLEKAQRRFRLTVEFCENSGEHKQTVDLEKCPDQYQELSICGSSWTKSKKARLWGGRSSGQCREELLEWFGHMPLVVELCEIWKKWHLNGMRAGTRAQHEFLTKNPPPAAPGHYEAACALLTKHGLNPDRGYTYGSQWLVDPLPPEVAKRILEILWELGPHPVKEDCSTPSV